MFCPLEHLPLERNKLPLFAGESAPVRVSTVSCKLHRFIEIHPYIPGFVGIGSKRNWHTVLFGQAQQARMGIDLFAILAQTGCVELNRNST